MNVLVIDRNKRIGIRAVKYTSTLGNFGVVHFRVNGVHYSAIPESFRDDETGLPVVDLHYARRYGDPLEISIYKIG